LLENNECNLIQMNGILIYSVDEKAYIYIIEIIEPSYKTSISNWFGPGPVNIFQKAVEPYFHYLTIVREFRLYFSRFLIEFRAYGDICKGKRSCLRTMNAT